MDRQVASWKWLKESLLSGKTVSNYVTDSSPSDGESVTYKDLKNNFAVSGKVDDFSNKTEFPSKIYIHQYSKSSSNYELNQVINREDLSIEGSDKIISQIEISSNESINNGNMDPMGGIALQAILYYNTGEQETDTDQSHFSITKVDNQDSTSQNLYITGTASTSIGNVTVVNNQINNTSFNKNKHIEVVYTNGTTTKNQTLLIKQKYDDLGYFNKGQGTITNGQLGSKVCSNLTDSNWVDDDYLLDYGSGMLNQKLDWYITTEKDTKYEQGTIIPANPIPNGSSDYTGNHRVTDAQITIPFRISWLKDQANKYNIYKNEEYTKTVNCPQDKIQDQTAHDISIEVSHTINYKQPTHKYGKYSILYAEAYPDKFTYNGFPLIINHSYQTDSKYSSTAISNSSCTNDNQFRSGQFKDPEGTTFSESTTKLANRASNEPLLTVSNETSFLSPEVCKRDESGNIVYDTTGSITRTIFGDTTEYNYNMYDTVETKQEYSPLTAENNTEYASSSCGTTWPYSGYDVYLILPYEYTFTTMDQAIADGYLKGSNESIPLPADNPIIGRDSYGIEHHKYEISLSGNYVDVYELKGELAKISSTKCCKANYCGILTNNNNVSITKSFNLVDTTGPANITCDRSDIIINPTSITTTGSNTFTVSFNTSNKTPGDVNGTITCGSYTMEFSITDSYNDDSLRIYGGNPGFPDSISRSQLKAAGLDKGNVF